jgi:hypothetical protein
MDKKGPHVAETEVGQGGTSQWRMCGVDADASVAVFFEITGGGAGQQQQEGQVRCCGGSGQGRGVGRAAFFQNQAG